MHFTLNMKPQYKGGNMDRLKILFICAVMIVTGYSGVESAQAGCWNTPPSGPFVGELGKPGNFHLFNTCFSQPVTIQDDGTLTSIGKVTQVREKRLVGPETCKTVWTSEQKPFPKQADTWITLFYPAVDTGCPAGSAKIHVIVKDTRPPSIGLYPQYSPKTLPYTGGKVVVTQDVSDVSGVTGVSLSAKEINNSAPPLTQAMNLVSGTPASGKWSATLQVPENQKNSQLTFYFKCIAKDPSGLTSEGLCGYVEVAARPDREPPAIVSYTAAPEKLASSGGDVVTTVHVKDNLGVTRVSAWAVKPDGSKTGVSYMKMQSGTATDGTWTMTWPLWVNGSNQPVTWTINITAYDAAGNQSSSSRSVVVDRKYAPPLVKPVAPVKPFPPPLPLR